MKLWGEIAQICSASLSLFILTSAFNQLNSALCDFNHIKRENFSRRKSLTKESSRIFFKSWVMTYSLNCEDKQVSCIFPSMKFSSSSSVFRRKWHFGKHYYHIIMPRTWNIHMRYLQGCLFNMYTMRHSVREQTWERGGRRRIRRKKAVSWFSQH